LIYGWAEDISESPQVPWVGLFLSFNHPFDRNINRFMAPPAAVGG